MRYRTTPKENHTKRYKKSEVRIIVQERLSLSHDQSSVLSISSSYLKQKRQEAKEATEQLLELTGERTKM